MTTFVFEGTSRKRYTYFLVADDVLLLPRQAGHYILAAGNPAVPVPVLIEAERNIREGIINLIATDHWRVAREVYGATLLYIHPDGQIDHQSRTYEKMDLIDSYRPVMNVHSSSSDT